MCVCMYACMYEGMYASIMYYVRMQYYVVFMYAYSIYTRLE
jgi:hypothetical protein